MKLKKIKIFLSGIITASLLLSTTFLTSHAEEYTVTGDVTGDGVFDIADVISLQKWLLHQEVSITDWRAGDFCQDNLLNIFDLCLMKQALLSQSPQPSQKNIISVATTEELKTALANARPGDEIILAEGEYLYNGTTPKGRMFTAEADGTEEQPIILRSEDPQHPAVISGTTTESNYALTITGDWWEIRDLKIKNASKGIILDNSNYTKLINCEVYQIGAEGIHFRDNSSYCLAESCKVHDTGLVSPGYGEAIYVGSAVSTTDYGHDCNDNIIRRCELGPNVTAEHIDVKEYTTGTIIEYCTFDGTGISGEHYADSFVDIKGNDCILRYCSGYRNGCEKINHAFSMNQIVEGWGLNAYIYGNKVYMDTALNAQGKKMYFLNAWNCSETVWDNFMAYESGELFSIDDPDDQWNYYNCSDITYGEASMESQLWR